MTIYQTAYTDLRQNARKIMYKLLYFFMVSSIEKAKKLLKNIVGYVII